jgi:hypothetical protein
LSSVFVSWSPPVSIGGLYLDRLGLKEQSGDASNLWPEVANKA